MDMPVSPLRSRSAPSLLDRTAAWLRHRPWFVLFVILPTVAAGIYYGLIASDVYISESRFVVKAPNQRQAQLSSIANIIQTTGLSGGQEQTNEVLDYIRSRNALVDASRRLDVRAIFTSPQADVLSRYPAPFIKDRFETLYRYYGRMVDVGLDHDTGLAILKVKAFTPEQAHTLNAQLLGQSEALVNRLNERAESRAIAEAERRVGEAQARLRTARLAVQDYRNDQALLDPAKQAPGVLDISNRLVAEQASLKAQLQSMQQVAPRNPAIPALRNRIAAIGGQIAAQNGRVVGGDASIASKIGGYDKVSVEQEFATQMLTAASASLEQARAEAQKQQFYLERVVEPNVPDMPLLPTRLQHVLTTFAAAACLYLIGWMLLVGVREHAPEH